MAKVDKKNIIILTLLLLLFIGLFFIYQYTYAKYRRGISGDVTMNVAKWQIKVNNEDISNGTVLHNSITPTFPGTQYIESGVLAPGASGYFDIEIDPNDTDVAFDYQMTIVSSNGYNDIKLDGYTINPAVNNTKTSIGNGVISGSFAIGDPAETIRVYVSWYDESDNVMDNSTDTYAVKTNNTLNFDLTLQFIQKQSA